MRGMYGAGVDTMTITSVIFDMDGTIFSTEPIYFKCYQQAAEPMGLKFTFELFESCIGMSVNDSAKLVKSYFGRDVDVKYLYDQCARNVDAYFAAHDVPFKPCAKETIAYFHKRGLKLGMATSNISRWVDILLEKRGLKGYFSSIVTFDHVSNPKPDPEVYLRSAQNLGADVSQCLAIEDSVAGATAAISAGMRTVVVPDLKQPNSFVRANAFRIYKSLCDMQREMDEVLG